MYQPFLDFLNFKFSLKIKKLSLSIPLPPLAAFLITGFVFFTFLATVQLKPEIGSHFFFSNDDPQMQEDKKIQELFPQDPQLIMSVKGDIHSDVYLERVRKLSDDLQDLQQVISVQSLSHGPGSLKNAKEGPLWSRILVSEDGKSSLLAIFIEDIDPEEFIPRIEAIVKKNEEKDFEILISGEPYIIELLRRNLLKDLKLFSGVAFILFGALFLFFFGSWKILIGTLLTCANASMLTLITTHQLGIETGMLTANLSTIVFVLTLSHLIFIIFNWRSAVKKRNKNEDFHPSVEALKMTLYASFWSMVTTALGFLSLLFVKAAPLKQLGAAGFVGTLVAFMTAYFMFPLFLSDRKEKVKKIEHEKHEKKIEPFFYRQHWVFFIILLALTVFISMSVTKVNTDPSLLAYFKKDTGLRNGLEYIDRNGGSSPLFMVVEEPEEKAFHQKKGYEKLWDVTTALESDEEVGSAVSLPVIIAQAEKNLIAKILTVEWLIDLLETKKFGRVAKYFITEERDKALIMLRMREQGRKQPRVDVLKRLESVVTQNGLQASLVGGVYSLQGRMSKLVTSSLISGLSLLLGLFVLMGWFLSKSLKIAGALFLSLLMIPVVVLGILGLFKIPLDVISSPAINIAMGMGVDAMIHMLIYVRRNDSGEIGRWKAWKNAAVHFWRPILYTAVIIGAGFGIFSLSGFPPTQRFGTMVVIGALMAPCTALVAFVNLSSLKVPFKKQSA